MGKTRLTREARREAILDAATEVFGRLGFEATRMEDVSKAAGIAKGLLYKHFSSKDALFQALIDRQGAAYAAELRGALADSDLDADPFGTLREGLAFWLRKVGDEAATFNVTDPGVHDAYDGLRDSLREVIADAIRRSQPWVTEPYPRLVASLIQGAAESLGLVWRAEPGGSAPTTRWVCSPPSAGAASSSWPAGDLQWSPHRRGPARPTRPRAARGPLCANGRDGPRDHRALRERRRTSNDHHDIA